MKVIRIKHCIYCPHCEGLAVASFYCKRLGRLPLNNTIPSNCPLEDDTPISQAETVKEILTVAIDSVRKWVDTGKIKVHNYPPSSAHTYAYITRVYREINENSLGWKEVDGEPIYFNSMTPEQKTLAIIMGQAQNALSILCEHENFITED